MSIKLSYDICKTVQYMHVNVINKSKKLKELRNEIKSLYNLSQPFQNPCVNNHTFYKPQNSITASIANINNRINKNQHALTGIESKLKEKYNDIKSINDLIKNRYKLGLVTNEYDYKNMQNVLTNNFKSEINDLNQQKEILKIRLNENENENENTLAYFNNKLDFLSYPNQETLNFLFYTEVFPNRIERELIPKQKINIDCIKNMIDIHKKGLVISLDSKMKIKTYTDFLKK